MTSSSEPDCALSMAFAVSSLPEDDAVLASAVLTFFFTCRTRP